MRNLLGDYVESARKEKGLSRGKLAELMGYKNLSRGCNRIVEVERGLVPDQEFLGKLIIALDLDPDTVNSHLMTMDEEAEAEFQKWLDEPMPMMVVIRYHPIFPVCYMVPSHILSEEGAIEYASQIAREKKHDVFLELNRRWSVLINSDGEIEDRLETRRNVPTIPYASFRGRKFRFAFQPTGRRSLTIKRVEP